MDEFQSQDELKPDTSDRPTGRTRKGVSPVRLPMSKRHIMTGIGILVLLLLILGIGSLLNGSKQTQSTDQNTHSEKPLALANTNTDNTALGSGAPNTALSAVPAQMPDAPRGDPHPAPVDQAADNTENNPSYTAMPSHDTQQTTATGSLPAAGLPVALATRNSAVQAKPTESVLRAQSKQPADPQTATSLAGINKAENHKHSNGNPQPKHGVLAHRAPSADTTKPVSSLPKKQTVASAPEVRRHAQNQSGGGYTLQLSAASQKQSLERWATQNKLTEFRIHQTQRNGRPWYILVSGNYPSSTSAKQAISHFPAAIRDKAPWVRALSQLEK